MCGVTLNNGGVLLSCSPLNPREDEEEEREHLIYVECNVSGRWPVGYGAYNMLIKKKQKTVLQLLHQIDVIKALLHPSHSYFQP